jgi:hypothetical protein
MIDKQGREYARLSTLKVGDRVQVDGGFTCMRARSMHTVKQDLLSLYIECDEGYHYLDNEDLIGIYKL